MSAFKKKRFYKFDHAKGTVVEFEREVVIQRPHYPLPVEALGIHPEQIEESMAFDRSKGVPTNYRPDGTPMIEDAAHYRKYRRAHGVHFRNGHES